MLGTGELRPYPLRLDKEPKEGELKSMKSNYKTIKVELSSRSGDPDLKQPTRQPTF